MSCLNLLNTSYRLRLGSSDIDTEKLIFPRIRNDDSYSYLRLQYCKKLFWFSAHNHCRSRTQFLTRISRALSRSFSNSSLTKLLAIKSVQREYSILLGNWKHDDQLPSVNFRNYYKNLFHVQAHYYGGFYAFSWRSLAGLVIPSTAPAHTAIPFCHSLYSGSLFVAAVFPGHTLLFRDINREFRDTVSKLTF